MNTSRAVRLLTRRVPLLLAFVLGAVLAGPAGADNVHAAEPAAAASASTAPAAAPTAPVAGHVDADRSSTAPAAAPVMRRTAIVMVAPRTLLDDGPRVTPAQRGPPPLFA